MILRFSYFVITVFLFPAFSAVSAILGRIRWYPLEKAGKSPVLCKLCLIRREDPRFKYHHGVDWVSVIRELILHLRGSKSGGSTITQQLVKNVMVHDWRRSYIRKIKEIECAIRIERFIGKEEILNLYFEKVRWGNLIGLRNASIAHFGKEPEDLNIYEANSVVAALTSAKVAQENPRRWERWQLFTCRRMGIENIALTPKVDISKGPLCIR